MTKTEALKLVTTVKLGYPVYYRNVTPAELEGMADLWKATLSRYSYDECYTAILAYLQSTKKGVLQTPAQIVDMIESLKEASKPEGTLTAVEAWEKYVRPAIRDGLYHSNENFEKMPEVVQEAIHSPDYLKELAMLPSETIDSVERSNFINRMYKTAVDRRADEARLPVDVRMMVETKRKENETAEERRIAAISSDNDATEFHKVESGDHTAEIEQLQRRLIG